MARDALRAPFDGEERTFRLAIGQIRALETSRRAGVGEILQRLSSYRWYVDDIRDVIRLGLEGGGMSEPEATARVMRLVDEAPLNAYVGLAADILAVVFQGLPDTPGKAPAGSDNPATSPPSPPPA